MRRKVQDALEQLRVGWPKPSLTSNDPSLDRFSDVHLDEHTLCWLEHDFNHTNPAVTSRPRNINVASLKQLASDCQRPTTCSYEADQNDIQPPLSKHGSFAGRSVDVRLRKSSPVSSLDNRHDWDCDLFNLAESSERGPLYSLTNALINDNGLAEKLSIPTSALHNFLKGLEDGYEDVPYHNSIHASDVLHALSFFLHNSDLSYHLTSVELFAAIIAAAAHDFRHPGVNNAFLINSGHEIAIRYNDKSVLENHHAAETFNLLMKAHADILSGLSRQERFKFRRILIVMILGTDMAHHFSNVTEFKARMEAGLNLQEFEDRLEFLKFMLKCADISNPAQEKSLAFAWAHRITREKLDQGKREVELGIEVNGVSDEESFSTARNQIDFIDFLVYPTLSLLWMFETSLHDTLEPRLKASRDAWCRQLEDEDLSCCSSFSSETRYEAM
jgi:hypothetical protein